MSRPPRGKTGPPAVVRFLLRLLIPKEEREFYLGDLEESGRRPWLRELAGAAGGARTAIVALVLRQGMTPIALGLVVGALLAAPVAWRLQGVLLEVQPFDPLVFGGVVAVLLGAGWLGCMLPALRATRVDPMVALAEE